ncbi:MAG: hypothetical protein WC486_05245 [Candidatus Omnitrophota bacterium]
MKAQSTILMLIAVFVLTGLTGCKPAKKYAVHNDKPASSGSNTSVVSKPVNKSGAPACSNCYAGLVIPPRDSQIIDDSDYTEVIALDSSKWDSARLPQKVVELQGKGYVCSPKFPAAEQPSQDLKSRSEVKTVQWECQQIYRDYRNLTAHEMDKKEDLEKQGFSCQKVNCFDDREGDTFAWFCSK